MTDPSIRIRSARTSPTADDGWDALAHAVRSGSPSFSALVEAIGLYLHEHRGRLWQMTEAEQRALVRAAHDIDSDRRSRRP